MAKTDEFYLKHLGKDSAIYNKKEIREMSKEGISFVAVNRKTGKEYMSRAYKENLESKEYKEYVKLHPKLQYGEGNAKRITRTI